MIQCGTSAPDKQERSETLEEPANSRPDIEEDLWTLLGEILDMDPTRLHERPLDRWRALHEQFFSSLAAVDLKRSLAHEALDRVLHVVNQQTPPLSCEPLTKNRYAAWLTAKRNELAAMGLTDFPPITVKELGDLATAYSLRTDYSKMVDITNLPAKALLFFAGLFARVYAGLDAEHRKCLEPERPSSGLVQELRKRNRSEGFTWFPLLAQEGHSILELRAAGFQPVFSHEGLFSIFTELGIKRIELRPKHADVFPPQLRVFLQEPVREDVVGYVGNYLDLVILTTPLHPAAASDNIGDENAFVEWDEEALGEFAIDERSFAERRVGTVLKLLWLVASERIVAGPFWATSAGARRLACAMGRTTAERFAIERFFSLSFRTASANQPWLSRPAFPWKDARPELKDRYEALKQRVIFFQRLGSIDASFRPGAEVRMSSLQTRGDLSRSLQMLQGLDEFGPLANVFVLCNGREGWVIAPSEVVGLAKELDRFASTILMESLGEVQQTLNSLQTDGRWKAMFLFELSVSILDSIAASAGVRFSKTDPMQVREALRRGYERSFAVALEDAPSWKHRGHPSGSELRQQLEQEKRLIWDLALRPLHLSAGARLSQELHRLTLMQADHPLNSKPGVPLDSISEFQRSLQALKRWLEQAFRPLDARVPDLDLGCPLAGAVEFRQLVEQGQFRAAYSKAQDVLALLSRKKRVDFEQLLTELKATLRNGSDRKDGTGPHSNAAVKKDPS